MLAILRIGVNIDRIIPFEHSQLGHFPVVDAIVGDGEFLG
jgi:hypothetical protein